MRIWERLDRWANPVLVQDMRSWLRSRRFLGVYFLSLGLSQIVVLTLALQSVEQAATGAGLFRLLAGTLTFVLVGVIPFLLQDKFADELESGATELALVSRLSAGGLLRGKVMSGVAADLLFLAAVAPSLALAYLLGGVALGAAGLGVGLAIAGGLASTALGIVVAAVWGRRWVKVSGFFFFLAGLGGAAGVFIVLKGMSQGEWVPRSQTAVDLVLGGAFVCVLLLFLGTVAGGRLSGWGWQRTRLARLELSLLALACGVVVAFRPALHLWAAGGGSLRPADVVAGCGAGLLVLLVGAHFLLAGGGRAGTGAQPAGGVAGRVLGLFCGPGRDRLGAFMLVHLGGAVAIVFLAAEGAPRWLLLGWVLCAAALFGGGCMAQRGLARLGLVGERWGAGFTAAVVEVAWCGMGLLVWFLRGGALGDPVGTEWLATLTPLTGVLHLGRNLPDEAVAELAVSLGPVVVVSVVVWCRGAVAAWRADGRCLAEQALWDRGRRVNEDE